MKTTVALKESVSFLYEVLKANKGAVQGEGYIALLNSYKDAVAHPRSVMHKSSVAKSFKNGAGALGLSDDKGKAFLDVLLSLPYASSMAWRPWLPFRNLFQVFTILPMRTGNLHTSAKAAKKLMGKGTLSSTLDEMLSEGIIAKRGGSSSAEYMEIMRGASIEAPTKVGQFYRTMMDKGLSWYSWSDDVTRAVGYLASKDMFEKGMTKGLINGNFNADVFLKQSRADGLPPAIREEIVGYIQAGNVRAAETTMARANIDATLFDYGAVNKPMGAGGTMGHLYYQFGTYSLNYLQTFGSMLTHGSVSTKTRSFLAMSAGMGIIAGMMKGIGVQNASFLGYNMAMFNGGPYFQMAMNAVQASSNYPSLQRKLARDSLKKNLPFKRADGKLSAQWPALAPLGMQLKYAGKFLDDWNEGDYWGAFLDSMTIPQHKSRNE